MAVDATSLASFLPRAVVDRLALDPRPPQLPSADQSVAAAMFVDISGFTSLTERLKQRSRDWADQLSSFLNSVLGELIDLINAHGGDIVKFSGDALLVLWPADEGPRSIATRRAVQCGLAVQESVNGRRVDGATEISLNVIVSVGDVYRKLVGNPDVGWHFLVAGDPVTQIPAAQKHARPGEVILSPPAAEAASAYCGLAQLSDGHARVVGVTRALPVVAMQDQPLSPEMSEGLRAFIPDAVVSRLEAGQSQWLAEIRRASVLFAGVTGIEHAAPAALDQTQALTEVFQKCVQRYDGMAKDIGVDDKGTVLMAVFGLPPRSHEDDPLRAALAALDLRSGIRRLGLGCTVAVTTGRLFCGPVGNGTRREYTVYGDEVNLAARLMEAAAADAILCDEETRSAVEAQITVDQLPVFTLKGKAEPVGVCRLRGEEDDGAQTVIGREGERSTIRDHLERLKDGTGGVLIIEGEPGIGKSRLAGELLRQARATGTRCLVGAGDAMEPSTPYHAWRPVFTQLLGLGMGDDFETQTLRILEFLRSEDINQDLAPLLNVIMPFQLPDTGFTAQLRDEVRADNTRELLTTLLRRAAANAVLLLEDTHWLDSASWALALRAAQDIDSMLLVVTSRPPSDPSPPEYDQLAQRATSSRLNLGALSFEETLTLLRQRLGVQEISESLADVIHGRSEGNPFFTEQLACALRDKGLIMIDDGVCRSSSQVRDLAALDVPTTIEGVITSRIDLLTPTQQLALKLASVIGPTFDLRLLTDIYPADADKASLADNVEAIRRLELTAIEDAASGRQYTFRHIITQEVAYGMMLVFQRREVHRDVAEWYERNHADDLAQFFPLLAHHWSKAAEGEDSDHGSVAKALDYLERAGDQAARNYANQEAIQFFLDAKSISRGTDSDSQRMAHWEARLGQAYVGLGQLQTARGHLETALDLMGWPVPTGRVEMVAGLMGQAARQFLHRAWTGRFVGAAPDRASTIEAARAYGRLLEIYMFFDDQTLTSFAALRNLNLAERAGHSPELAEAYSMARVAARFLSPALADVYGRLAQGTVDAVSDLPSEAWVVGATGYYLASIGRWEEAQSSLDTSLELSDRLGYRRLEEIVTTIQGIMDVFHGDYQKSRERFRTLHEQALRRGAWQSQFWGLSGLGRSMLRHGELDEAARSLQAALEVLGDAPEWAGRADTTGMLAVTMLRQGDLDAAMRQADIALSLMRRGRPQLFTVMEGYAGTAEVFLRLMEIQHQQRDTQRRALSRSAKQACQTLLKATRAYPVWLPQALIWRGLYEATHGKEGKALRTWQRSLRTAREFGLPYEQGLAAYEIGRHLPESEPERSAYLAQASDVFVKIGDRYHQAQVQRETGSR